MRQLAGSSNAEQGVFCPPDEEVCMFRQEADVFCRFLFFAAFGWQVRPWARRVWIDRAGHGAPVGDLANR